jgi:hypothetical protein
MQPEPKKTAYKNESFSRNPFARRRSGQPGCAQATMCFRAESRRREATSRGTAPRDWANHLKEREGCQGVRRDAVGSWESVVGSSEKKRRRERLTAEDAESVRRSGRFRGPRIRKSSRPTHKGTGKSANKEIGVPTLVQHRKNVRPQKRRRAAALQISRRLGERDHTRRIRRGCGGLGQEQRRAHRARVRW